MSERASERASELVSDGLLVGQCNRSINRSIIILLTLATKYMYKILVLLNNLFSFNVPLNNLEMGLL